MKRAGAKMDKWIQQAVGVVGEARKKFAEFVQWLQEQGYTDEEIYQLVLIWMEPLGPRDD